MAFDPRLRLDLHVTYADGSEEVVRSDGSWKVSVDGPRRSDSLHLGETYDARKEKLDPAGKASTDGNGLVYGQLQTDYHVVRADGAPSVTLVGVEDGRVAYEVGSGRYRFRVEARRAH